MTMQFKSFELLGPNHDAWKQGFFSVSGVGGGGARVRVEREEEVGGGCGGDVLGWEKGNEGMPPWLDDLHRRAGSPSSAFAFFIEIMPIWCPGAGRVRGNNDGADAGRRDDSRGCRNPGVAGSPPAPAPGMDTWAKLHVP